MRPDRARLKTDLGVGLIYVRQPGQFRRAATVIQGLDVMGMLSRYELTAGLAARQLDHGVNDMGPAVLRQERGRGHRVAGATVLLDQGHDLFGAHLFWRARRTSPCSPIGPRGPRARSR